MLSFTNVCLSCKCHTKLDEAPRRLHIVWTGVCTWLGYTLATRRMIAGRSSHAYQRKVGQHAEAIVDQAQLPHAV
eukprot:5332345-Pyramimonas_sp.AAC.1